MVSFNAHHVHGERNADDGAAPGPLMRGRLKLNSRLIHHSIVDLVSSYGLSRAVSLIPGASNFWHAVSPLGIMTTTNTTKHSPVFDFYYASNPRFTYASDTDDIEFYGELGPKHLDFKPKVYQYDPHIA